MARQRIDRETKKVLFEARKIISDAARTDRNEAGTRKRVERIFESVMGYDVFKHMSSEYAVHGAGETEHCDFAIQLDQEETTKPIIFVELKRVNVDLARKHLKQVSSYAINAGCEWIILTNGREWRLYLVSFGQPPETKLINSWNLLQDDPVVLAEKFELIGYRNVRSGGLDKLKGKANALTPNNLLSAILSEDSIRLLRRQLRKATDKATGVVVTPEEVVGAIRRILNEVALGEMENIKISLPEKKHRSKKRKSAPSQEEKSSDVQTLEDPAVQVSDVTSKNQQS